MSGLIGKAGTKSGIVGYSQLSVEVGTWTPAVGGDSGCSATVASSYGRYTRVGQMVLAEFDLTLSAFSCIGAATIAGLPFKASVAVSSKWTSGGFCTYAGSLSGLPTYGAYITMHIEPNTNFCYLRNWDTNTGPTNLSPGEVSADGTMAGTFIYQTEE